MKRHTFAFPVSGAFPVVVLLGLLVLRPELLSARRHPTEPSAGSWQYSEPLLGVALLVPNGWKAVEMRDPLDADLPGQAHHSVSISREPMDESKRYPSEMVVALYRERNTTGS